jgi:hypothetical protein
LAAALDTIGMSDMGTCVAVTESCMTRRHATSTTAASLT